MSAQTIIERAFQLAREGECRSIEDIRKRLKAEHYEAVSSHLDGVSIKRQLKDAMATRSEGN